MTLRAAGSEPNLPKDSWIHWTPLNDSKPNGWDFLKYELKKKKQKPNQKTQQTFKQKSSQAPHIRTKCRSYIFITLQCCIRIKGGGDAINAPLQFMPHSFPSSFPFPSATGCSAIHFYLKTRCGRYLQSLLSVTPGHKVKLLFSPLSGTIKDTTGMKFDTFVVTINPPKQARCDKILRKVGWRS